MRISEFQRPQIDKNYKQHQSFHIFSTMTEQKKKINKQELDECYEFVGQPERSMWKPDVWPEDLPRKTPSNIGDKVKLLLDDVCEAVDLQETVEDLRTRIEALPMPSRPVPQTVDPSVLGIELKVRLAASSPTLTEREMRDGKVIIDESWPTERNVPIYEADDESDNKLACYFKLRMKKNRCKMDCGDK